MRSDIVPKQTRRGGPCCATCARAGGRSQPACALEAGKGAGPLGPPAARRRGSQRHTRAVAVAATAGVVATAATAAAVAAAAAVEGRRPRIASLALDVGLSRSHVAGQWRRRMGVGARGPPAALRAMGLRVTPERVKGGACAMVCTLQSGRVTPQCVYSYRCNGGCLQQ